MAYTRVNWEDLPSTDTPINATNLNKMDEGIYNNSFESGSNANGSYIKFNDGTLICAKHISGSTPCNIAWGSLYETSSINLGSYAMNFISAPYVSITPNMTAGALFEGVRNVTASSFGQVWLVRTTSNDNLSYGIDCIAIGKWK